MAGPVELAGDGQSVAQHGRIRQDDGDARMPGQGEQREAEDAGTPASANRRPELGLSSAESSAAPRTEGGEESMKQGVPRLSCPWQTSGVRPAFLQAFCPCPTPAPVASPFLFGRGKATCCERSTRKWQFKQFQIVKPYLHHSDTTCPVSGARA